MSLLWTGGLGTAWGRGRKALALLGIPQVIVFAFWWDLGFPFRPWGLPGMHIDHAVHAGPSPLRVGGGGCIFPPSQTRIMGVWYRRQWVLMGVLSQVQGPTTSLRWTEDLSTALPLARDPRGRRRGRPVCAYVCVRMWEVSGLVCGLLFFFFLVL